MAATGNFPPTLKTVQIEVKNKYVIITLNRPPVNGMNFDLWSDLLTALDATEKQPTMRGAIFASGLAKDVFTAGIDLTELYAKTTTGERFQKFWVTMTTFLTRLYTSRLVTIAAIRGACPAGGCGMAMACDYRIMTNDTPGAVIGLNEVALGISVPRYWIVLYERLVGYALAEQTLLQGRMLPPVEALSAGLVNQLVSKENLMAEAEKAIQVYFKNPDTGRIITKLEFRTALGKQWRDYAEEEARTGWENLNTPAVSGALGQVLARLSGPAKPKAKL